MLWGARADMAQPEENNTEISRELTSDEVNQLKRRARRRLIGAVALALFAALILPMVMDHQPAPSLKDIQIRIPSPDEGGSQRIAAKPAVPPAEARKEAPPKAEAKAEQTESKPEPKTEPKVELKAEPKVETKPEAKAEVKVDTKSKEPAKPATEEPVATRGTSEAWEVQLGAYGEPARVKLLVGKLKQLGLPTYTENVDTPNGARTRVRAGPFPSQEAAEKARVRIKIIGVDGPVARKP